MGEIVDLEEKRAEYEAQTKRLESMTPLWIRLLDRHGPDWLARKAVMWHFAWSIRRMMRKYR